MICKYKQAGEQGEPGEEGEGGGEGRGRGGITINSSLPALQLCI
jgi:hypothetical protein